MTKISNPTKLLLLSLAPLIAHQTTYGAQQQNQQAPVDLAQFVGMQPIVAPQQVALQAVAQPVQAIANNLAHDVFNAFLDGFKVNQDQVLHSTVADSITEWKQALAGQAAQQPGWHQTGRAILSQDIQNNAPLKNVRDALYNAIMIDMSDANNGAIDDRAKYIDQANNAQAGAIFNRIQNLAKALYEFKNSDKWDDLNNLITVYALICTEDTIDVGQNPIALANLDQGDQQQQNDNKAALQEALENDIDEFLGTLAYWRGKDILTFTEHTRLQDGNLDNPQGVQKFIDFFDHTAGNLKNVIDIDEFYQFSDINPHNNTDLNDQNMNPEAFMNPYIKHKKLTQKHKSALRTAITDCIQEEPYIQGLDAKLDIATAYQATANINPAQISIDNVMNIINNFINNLAANYLDTNRTWKDNIETNPKDYETVIKAIKNKIKTDTGATDGMIDEFLESKPDPNAQDKVIDHINAITIQDYSQITTLDELVDAILTELANVNVNGQTPFSQQALRQTLDTIKLTDTDYFKKSQEQLNNQQNQLFDKKVAAEIQRIEEFCTNNLGINIDWNIIKIQKNKLQGNNPANTNYDVVVDAVKAAYPQITVDQANTLRLLYLPFNQMQDIVRDNEPQMTLLKTATNDNQLDVTALSVNNFMSAIRSITNDHFKKSAIEKFNLIDNANGEYIKKQEAPDDENIKTSIKNKLIADGDVINKDANAIAQVLAGNQNLKNALKNINEFKDMFIERTLDEVLRAFGNQLVRKSEFDNLQGQLNKKNAEFEQYKMKNSLISEVQKVVEKKKVEDPKLNTSHVMVKILEGIADLPNIGAGQRRKFKIQSNEILKAAGVTQVAITGLTPLKGEQEQAITKVLNSQDSYYQIREHIKGKNIQLAFRTMLAYK